MTHPGIALQAALYSRLTTSHEVTSMLGGMHIFDDVPTEQKPPYIVFAQSVYNDWSTGTEDGMEHSISLHVWSDENGRKEVLTLSQKIIAAMNDLPKQLDDNLLVNFSHEFTEVSKDEDAGLFLAKLNFRAVTEPHS